MAESYVLAADLGGTNLRTAVVSRDGAVRHLRRSSTPDGGPAADIVQAVVDEARACIAMMPDAPVAFGIAAAALINTSGTRVLRSPNLPQLDGLPLARMLSDSLGISVVLENDATAAAVGESWLGASKDILDSICITLGTGVGGGLIINGRPVRGAG